MARFRFAVAARVRPEGSALELSTRGPSRRQETLYVLQQLRHVFMWFFLRLLLRRRVLRL